MEIPPNEQLNIKKATSSLTKQERNLAKKELKRKAKEERNLQKRKFNALIDKEIRSHPTKKDRKYIRNKFRSFKYTAKFLNITLQKFKDIYIDELSTSQITLIDIELRRERLKGKRPSTPLYNQANIKNNTLNNESKNINKNPEPDKRKIKLEGAELLNTYRHILKYGGTEIRAASECGWDYKNELGWFKQAVQREINNQKSNEYNNELKETNNEEINKTEKIKIKSEEVMDRKILTSLVTRKVRSSNFRKEVIKTYGSKCACCEISITQLIEAAHIIPVELDGNDHPLNGIPLCANHHLAFDSFLFAINPDNLKIIFSPDINAKEIGITKEKIIISPNQESLRYRMNMFCEKINLLSNSID